MPIPPPETTLVAILDTLLRPAPAATAPTSAPVAVHIHKIVIHLSAPPPKPP